MSLFSKLLGFDRKIEEIEAKHKKELVQLENVYQGEQPDNHNIPRKEESSMDNDNVIIQTLGSKSKRRQSYYGVNLEGKKGKIIRALQNSKREEQGYRVRFPEVKIEEGPWNRHKKTVKNFEFAFYKDEVKRIKGDLELPKPRKTKTRKMLKSNKAAVRRLRAREGLKIKDLAERFDVNERTIYRWLNENPDI